VWSLLPYLAKVVFRERTNGTRRAGTHHTAAARLQKRAVHPYKICVGKCRGAARQRPLPQAASP
jgi:hypothetical protein